jgi:hypothetical protein
MLKRLAYCIVAFLLNIDMACQTLILSPVYIVTGHWKPNARLTISGFFGWAQSKGYAWGRIGAEIIDDIMFNRKHCAEAFVLDSVFEVGL